MAKKTIKEGFDTFLDSLVPLSSEYDKANSHKNSVSKCLESRFDCYRFFETGSFGSGTGVRHFSDSDFFAVMPKDILWNDSSFTLKKLKEGLKRTFPNTIGIKVDCPSVKIPFGKYKSEDMEITPCCDRGYIKTSLGNFRQYEIPDGDGGWMLASPRAHNEYVTQQDKRLNYKLKNLIRLVKAWKYYNDVPIKSFYLELRCTKWAENESTIEYEIDLYTFLKHLQDKELAKIKSPTGISEYINASKTDIKKEIALSKLNRAISRAEKAQEAEVKGNIDKAFYWWNKLFNNKFPKR